MPQSNAAAARGANPSDPNARPATQNGEGAQPQHPKPGDPQPPKSRRGAILDILKVPGDIAEEVLKSTPVEPEGEGEPTTPQGEAERAEPQGEGEPTQPTGAQPEGEPTTPQGEQGEPEGGEREGEAAEATDEDLPKPNKNWPPEVQAEFEKRIGRISRQRTTAKERAETAEALVEELQQRLEASQPVNISPTESNPLAHVQDARALASVVSEAKLLKQWCRKNRNGVVKNEGTEQEVRYSAEDIQDMLDKAEDVLQEHAPRRAEQLKAEANYNTLAQTQYPWIFQKGTVGYQTAQAVIADMPGLATHPARNLIIGDYLAGINLRLEKMSKNGGGKDKKKASDDLPPELTRQQPPMSPHTAKPPSKAVERPSSTKKVDDATKRVVETGGSKESLVAAVRAVHDHRRQAPTGREPVKV